MLYGLGPVAEKTSEWNYVLSDGINVPRQLTDDDGLTTLSVRYNPWGKPIETSGIGNFDASFIGTLIDATTGLIYIGNGQYYDPETGRFLTRGVNPNSTNPYVPWNPIGALFGPLGIVSAYYSRKKSKRMPWMALIFILLVTSACALCPQSLGTGLSWEVDTPPNEPQTPNEAVTEESTVTEEAEETAQPGVGQPETGNNGICVGCPPSTPSYTPTPSPSLEQVYNITFIVAGAEWTALDKDSALRAVVAVAEKLREFLGGTAADAWAQTYEYMNFQMGNCTKCADGGESAGYTVDRHNIQFAGISNTGEKGRNLVVHELGHAFKALLHNKTGIDAYVELTNWRVSHPGYPDRGKFNGEEGATGPKVGFYSLQNQTLWQVSLEGGDDEEFADQFLGWTFNMWETDDVTGLLADAGQARADMMNANMPNWITRSAGP